jgi:putative addiction module component (TIGR02574 family)
MNASVEILFKQAIDLPKEQQIELVNLLMAGAETAEEEGADEAWGVEIARRVESIDKGQGQFISAEQVDAKIDRLLNVTR